jgi:hypothetical protein
MHHCSTGLARTEGEKGRAVSFPEAVPCIQSFLKQIRERIPAGSSLAGPWPPSDPWRPLATQIDLGGPCGRCAPALQRPRMGPDGPMASWDPRGRRGLRGARSALEATIKFIQSGPWCHFAIIQAGISNEIRCLLPPFLEVEAPVFWGPQGLSCASILSVKQGPQRETLGPSVKNGMVIAFNAALRPLEPLGRLRPFPTKAPPSRATKPLRLLGCNEFACPSKGPCAARRAPSNLMLLSPTVRRKGQPDEPPRNATRWRPPLLLNVHGTPAFA